MSQTPAHHVPGERFLGVGNHDGTIEVLWEAPADYPKEALGNEFIVMPCMKNGSLQEYLSSNKPSHSLQCRWIQSLAATIAFCHNKHVLLADIASRNYLLDEDLSLKLCDFGESAIIPLDQNMAEVNDNGVFVKTDIAQFGSLVFEISTAKQPRLNFVEDEIPDTSGDAYEESGRESESESGEDESGDEGYESTKEDSIRCVAGKPHWPRIEDLPSTDETRFDSIIEHCWRKG